MPFIRHRVFSALLLACVAIASLAAQGLTGSISGVVTDETGAVLPGVTVTIESPALIGGSQMRITETNGAFRFPVLPPGEYKASFQLTGFGGIARAAIIVQPDRTVTLDQVLRPAAVSEEILVTGETPLVDVKNTQLATIVDQTAIEQVPVARRFTDLLNVMPGVQNGLYTFSPINSVYGSRVTNNTYSVDGVNFNDPQVQSAVTDIPYDDLQEVQVSTSGQSAEFGSASGGVFNFITKSGSNQVHGLASFYGQNERFASNNISDELAAVGIRPSVFDHDYEGGGNLGGPIKRDRLWFFVSHYRQDQDRSQSDFPVPIETNQWQSTLKADGQVSSSQRFGVYYNYRDRYTLPWNPSFQVAGDPRTWGAIAWKNHLLGVNWTMTPGTSTVLQLRGGLATFDLVNLSPNVVPGTPVYTETTTGVASGGVTASAGLAQRDRYEFNANLSRFFKGGGRGSHEVKIGLQYEDLPMDTESLDVSDANYVRHQLLDGQPYRAQLLRGPGHALTTINHWGLFVQDQWSLTSRLTLNAGVRYDHWNGSLGPDVFEAGPWDTAERVDEISNVIPLWHVAPRVGVAWDVTGSRRWAVKASYGRFYQRVAGTDISGLRRTTGGSLTYDWIDRNGDRVFQAGEEGTLRADGRRNPATFGVVDPNLKMPYTDSLNAGVEVQFATAFSLAVNGIVKRERDFRSNVDVTKPFDTAYDLVNVINPLTGAPMEVYSIKPEFQGIPSQSMLTNPSDPVELFHDYDGLEVVLKRRLQNRWMFQGSYNWGHSYGTVGTLFFDAQGSPYSNPNNLIFIEGDQKLDRRHMLKLSGLYELPYGIQFSGRFEVLSGVPLLTTGSGGAGVTGAYSVRFDRTQYPAIRTSAFLTVPGEAQGSRRHGAETRVDVRLQKRTTLMRQMSVDVMLDIFNLLNASTVVRVETLNSTLTNFLRPAEIMLPRAARFGLRLNF
jgi:outer membrane receptor protein involved in Fe transport